ncbi:hypothetical protein H4S07_002345, partial [Coemansia furcata]
AKSETKYIDILGNNYQPQPKGNPAWLPKLTLKGKSSWTDAELDTFSDETRKILKSDKDIAPLSLEPENDSLLILTPVKNNAKHLTKYFELIENLDYPRNKISLAFLISDSTDETQSMLIDFKKKFQEEAPEHKRLKRFEIYRQDFFYDLPRGQRHDRDKQRDRRIVMARARNYLWTRALQNEQWVLWIDGDLHHYPPSILHDLMAYDKDIIVPNCYIGDMVYDRNAFQETPESLALMEKLVNDDFLSDVFIDLEKRRKYLYDFKEDETLVPLDGVGGTFTLVKAHVHRSGIGFPTWPFEHQVETEGFSKLAKFNGYSVYGLPFYKIWHVGN